MMWKYQKPMSLLLAGLLCTGTLAGCASSANHSATEGSTVMVEMGSDEMSLDMVPLAASPAVSSQLNPTAPGTAVAKNDSAAIDYSNVKDGYVMISWLAGSGKIKVQITGPSGTTYTYNLNSDGNYEVFPLSDGSGSYQINVLSNVEGNKYALGQSATVTAAFTDEFAPFLRPNQYVNFNAGSKVVSKAAEVTAGQTDELKKVEAVYNYVIKNISYDTDLASSVQSGYLPNVDSVLAKGKGICFDYAAVMTAMLRSQNIPTKLVVGYSGSVYHAWINVYSSTEGWIDGVIVFDGQSWKLMDPTFASTANNSSEIQQYIGDGKNYTAKYLY